MIIQPIWGREQTSRPNVNVKPERPKPEDDSQDDLDTWWATVCGPSRRRRV